MRTIDSDKRIAPFLISVLVCLAPITASTQDINAILTKMEGTNCSVRYQGRLTTILVNTPFPQVSHYQITNFGDFQRREELLSDDASKEISFDDGKNLWRFFPGRNLLIKEQSPLNGTNHDQPRCNLDLVKQNYQIQVAGAYKVNGREGYRVLFQPWKKDRPQQIYWIDNQTGIPVKVEKYGPQDKLVSISSFSDLQFCLPSRQKAGPLMVPARTQLVEIKEDQNLSVPKAEALLGTKILVPTYLPPGFILKNVIVRTINDTKCLQLSYSDGLSSLSVFQQPNPPPGSGGSCSPFGREGGEMRETSLQTRGALNVLIVRADPNLETLMGEIFADEIVKVAQSIFTDRAILTKPELSTPFGGAH